MSDSLSNQELLTHISIGLEANLLGVLKGRRSALMVSRLTARAQAGKHMEWLHFGQSRAATNSLSNQELLTHISIALEADLMGFSRPRAQRDKRLSWLHFGQSYAAPNSLSNQELPAHISIGLKADLMGVLRGGKKRVNLESSFCGTDRRTACETRQSLTRYSGIEKFTVGTPKEVSHA